MNLSSIQLLWLIIGCSVLLLVAVLMGVLRVKQNSGKEKEQMDSWERNEERRRKKEAVYATASYVLLFGCASVAAALSFHGLVGFGQQNLGLSGGWEYLVPFGLDGAAMFCSVLAVREASHGDAALGSRILVWLFASASAWFNWVHAPRGDVHNGAPQFFAGMSISAAVLFDRALKQTRRAALREQGLIPRPLPQIRIVRWLRAPIETYKAWSLMLLEGVRTLDEAVEEVREDKRNKELQAARERAELRRERAELRAIRSGGGWHRRGGRQVPALTGGSGSGETTTEPAVASSTPLDGAAPSPDSAGLEPASTRGLRGLPRAHRAGALSAGAGSSSAGRGADGGSIPSSLGSTFDLTAEDDTSTLPRLDSLEKKLQDLERQWG